MLSAAGENAVGTFEQSFYYKRRVYPPCTHDPDGSKIRRILESGYTCCVCCGVTAPVTQESQDLRIKFLIGHHILLNVFLLNVLPMRLFRLRFFFFFNYRPNGTKGFNLRINLLISETAHRNGKCRTMSRTDSTCLT